MTADSQRPRLREYRQQLGWTQQELAELPHEGPLADRGIVARFDHIGLHVNEVEEILHIRNATAEEARRLELSANRPVVEITQTFRVAGTDIDEDIAVATVDIVFAADRYELRYLMEIK